MSLAWKRAVDRWNLVDDEDTIVGAVTDEVLATVPELFGRERESRGWPEIPEPVHKAYAEWIPLAPGEILRILDGRP